MGIFAITNITIICTNKKSAEEAKKAIIKRAEEAEKDDGHEDFNYSYEDLEIAGSEVYLTKSSSRIQNLEYQMEELWNLIKGIKGVEEMSAPFLAEADGKWFSNIKEDK